MIEKNKNIKVTIFGDEYSLVTDESHDQIKQAAHLVDTYMQEIVHKGFLSNEKKIAVLGALRLASKVMQLETIVQNEQKKEQDLIALLDRALL